MIVHGKAFKNNFPAFNEEFGNLRPKIEKPAGFGAFAKIVRPPPTKAPDTKAHFEDSVIDGTCDPRYVKAALSVTAVKAIAPAYKALSLKPCINGSSHHF